MYREDVALSLTGEVTIQGGGSVITDLSYDIAKGDCHDINIIAIPKNARENGNALVTTAVACEIAGVLLISHQQHLRYLVIKQLGPNLSLQVIFYADVLVISAKITTASHPDRKNDDRFSATTAECRHGRARKPRYNRQTMLQSDCSWRKTVIVV
jgi:hypothetical protein